MTEANRTEDRIAENAKRLGNELSLPIPYETNRNGDYVVRDVHGGLTKRETFAAMAMQNLAVWPIQKGDAELAAIKAVEFSDALLKELAK